LETPHSADAALAALSSNQLNLGRMLFCTAMGGRMGKYSMDVFGTEDEETRASVRAGAKSRTDPWRPQPAVVRSMEPNPYAPPKATVADRSSASSTGLGRRRVIVMIVLTIVTFGLYYPIWFFRRRGALNRLNSPRKLRLWPFTIFCTVTVVDVVVVIASGPGLPAGTIGAAAADLLRLARLAAGVLMLVQCFLTKDILEDHLAGPEDDVSHSLFVERVKLSGLMTFFFQIFYLQYVINHYLADPTERAA
jgi:hypothetical protein